MIEANENIDLVTMRHEGDMHSSRESYQRAVSEGRLAVGGHGGAVDTVATSAPIPTTATERQPDKVSDVPANPETTWRYTRLAITAGLVVLLLVVWIWQKRAGR